MNATRVTTNLISKLNYKPNILVTSFMFPWRFIGIFLFSLMVVLWNSPSARAKETASPIQVDVDFNRAILDKVDAIVRPYSWHSKRLEAWANTMKRLRPKILESKDLIQLELRINEALMALGSSHTQLLTINDESFYLLHCLFSLDNKRVEPRIMDFTGITTSDVSINRIRYVLDHSPAFRVGIKTGDEILSVNGKPFRGQINFLGTAGQQVLVSVQRNDKVLNISMIPEKVNLYNRYVEAIKDSVRAFKSNNRSIGYIHYWIGGKPARDVLESALAHNLCRTDGLIFDLRDGYGAAWVDDLDFFFRPENAYPQELRYSKPVVAIINHGTRSGKEVLAFSLQNSGRAKLIGEQTSGACLPAMLFPLDKRVALYLPLRDLEFMGRRIEGNGVLPDIDVSAVSSERSNVDIQYETALSTLLGILDRL